MSLRLEKQSLSIETIVGENTAQSVIEGSVTVPGSKPEIGRALWVQAQPQITGYDVVDGRVAIEGTLDVNLLYASFTEVESAGEGDEDSEPELILEERLEKAAFTGAVPFAFVLDVPGAEPGVQAQPAVTVESVSYEVQGDQRTVEIDVVLNFGCVLKKTIEQVLTTRAITDGDVSLGQREVRLKTAAVAGKGQTHVTGHLSFGGRVLPEQVLELTVKPSAAPVVKIADGAVEITGNLSCGVLYTAQEVGAAKAEWPDAIPFQIELPLPGCPAQARADVSLSIVDPTWHVVDADENRGLELDATVLATVRAAVTQVVNVVTELASEGPLAVAVRTEPLAVQEAVGEGVLAFTADASLDVPSGATPVERVLLADARAKVEDVHVLGDKVAVEGAVSLNMVYVGRSGDTTSLAATAWPAGIPFECEIPVPGAEPGLERRVEISVGKVQVDLLNRETVDANVLLNAKVYLSRNVELDAVVEAVEVPAADPNPPTYTFVVLQEGDTLWQLAQRYHTEVAAILLANKWLEDENSPLTAGAKICIPRRRSVA